MVHRPSGRTLSGAGAEAAAAARAHTARSGRGLGRSGRAGLAVSATAHGRGGPGCGGAAGALRRGARTAATDRRSAAGRDGRDLGDVRLDSQRANGVPVPPIGADAAVRPGLSVAEAASAARTGFRPRPPAARPAAAEHTAAAGRQGGASAADPTAAAKPRRRWRSGASRRAASRLYPGPWALMPPHPPARLPVQGSPGCCRAKPFGARGPNGRHATAVRQDVRRTAALSGGDQAERALGRRRAAPRGP